MVDISSLYTYLQNKHGFSFSRSLLTASKEEKIHQRMESLGVKTLQAYLKRIDNSSEELELLINLLTINVSEFFRDCSTFALLAERVLPTLLTKKSLRIWSVGCARGEEPYSVALLLRELCARKRQPCTFHIFATDINTEVLDQARLARYDLEHIKNIPHGLVCKYFHQQNQTYTLSSKVRDLVSFSVYDITTTRTFAPPEAVFGGFDLVLCRNVLMYFSSSLQQAVFAKLHRSLAPEAYLVLGQAERLPPSYGGCFSLESTSCHIYRKHNIITHNDTGLLRISGEAG